MNTKGEETQSKAETKEQNKTNKKTLYSRVREEIQLWPEHFENGTQTLHIWTLGDEVKVVNRINP